MKLFRILACCLAFSATAAFAEDAAAPAAPAAADAAAPAAAAPVAAAPADAAPADAAPAAAVAATPELGKPAAGKGQVVFFRPPKFTGAVISFKVREDKQELGVLKNSSYFVADVAPGKHTYVVHSEAKDKLTLEVEEGEVYYVEGGITMGLLAGRPNLSPSAAEAFEASRAKMSMTALK
ncbi:MAG: hypothetical protein K0R03_239 [Moraxellaceae bacterium]|jgi:hypothetical protein|nr:hypothetical protein [Moraxellaceae bacterium]